MALDPAGTGINITGTYPSFYPIANTGSGIGLTDLDQLQMLAVLGVLVTTTAMVDLYLHRSSDSEVRALISVTDAGGDDSLAYNSLQGLLLMGSRIGSSTSPITKT